VPGARLRQQQRTVIESRAALGRLEAASEDSEPDVRPLTDGSNVIWIYRDREGYASATRFGLNDVTLILNAIEQVFGIGWVDEYDEDFGGDN
jgi:hypothetical protein